MFFSVIPVKELILSILHWYIKTRTIISLYFQKIVKGRTDVRRMNEWMNEWIFSDVVMTRDDAEL